MNMGSDVSSPRSQENIISLQLSQEREKIWKEASIFFKKNSANIEVVREDNNLEKTYFYLPPFCTAITKVINTENSNDNTLGY